MRRILFVSLLVAAAAVLLIGGIAYSRERAVFATSGAVQPGHSAAQANAGPRCGSQASAPISEEDALKAVWSLPEVQRQADYSRLHGARPFAAISSRPAAEAQPGAPEARYEVYFGEDLGDHISRIGSYSVDAFSSQVSTQDYLEDPSTP